MVKKIPAKEEFKVGDVLDPQGKTNMVGKVTIREISGNTLKFTDSEGTDFHGMARSQVRILVNEGAWKRVDDEMRRDTTRSLLKIREDSDNCREFFKDIDTGEVLITAEGVLHTLSRGGEPAAPVAGLKNIKIIPQGCAEIFERRAAKKKR